MSLPATAAIAAAVEDQRRDSINKSTLDNRIYGLTITYSTPENGVAFYHHTAHYTNSVSVMVNGVRALQVSLLGCEA